jgi:3-oxoacyl-[acyl-carrier-protein] synthase II
MTKRRVVITGIGCVTALAESGHDLFDALCAGKSGISLIESFDTSLYPTKIGGEVKNFDISKYADHREGKRMDRFSQFAVGSAVQAIKDSGLEFNNEQICRRTGVIVGTGIGGLQEIEEQHTRLLEKGPSKVSPFCVPKLMANAASGIISMMFGLKGPNFCIVTACATATHSVGEAYFNIMGGRSDIMITGGSEAALTPIGLASFSSLKALSTRNDQPTLASRPFDRDRDGFVLSEGAGIVVLEEYEHAKKRGARIYAEFLGYGATGDAYHITAPLPDGSGASSAMVEALNIAGLNREQIDYINAHGTSTSLNDEGESKAIKNVFGDHAYKLCISSTKSCLGHLLGASGGVELIACVKAIHESVIPPTINLDNVAEECDPKLDFVPKEARQAKVNYAMSNSLGFGGHNASLIVGKI